MPTRIAFLFDKVQLPKRGTPFWISDKKRCVDVPNAICIEVLFLSKIHQAVLFLPIFF